MPNSPVPAAATGLPSVIHPPCSTAGEGVRMTRIPSTLDGEGRATTASPSAKGEATTVCPLEPNTLAQAVATSAPPCRDGTGAPTAKARTAPQNRGHQDQHVADVRHALQDSRHDGANWPSVPASQKKDEAAQHLSDAAYFSPASGKTGKAGKLWENSIISSTGPLAKNDASEIRGLPHGTANLPVPGTTLLPSGQPSPCRGALAGRRGFLRGLLGLPLIGGAVSIIGQATAVSEPVTFELLDEYSEWLGWERMRICRELYGEAIGRRQEHSHSLVSAAMRWHFGPDQPAAPASTRAALVLATVGCNWREG